MFVQISDFKRKVKKLSNKTENPYANYSIESLQYAIENANYQLSMGQGNTERLLDMIDQMTEIIEKKSKTDYCEHGVYLYNDYDCACWQCEV